MYALSAAAAAADPRAKVVAVAIFDDNPSCLGMLADVVSSLGFALTERAGEAPRPSRSRCQSAGPDTRDGRRRCFATAEKLVEFALLALEPPSLLLPEKHPFLLIVDVGKVSSTTFSSLYGRRVEYTAA